MDSGPKFGQLITDGDNRRDATHVATAPGKAAVRMAPGTHVGLIIPGDMETVGPCDNPIAIVDPFLPGPVEAGERFWLFLYPNTITGLRHVWTHPAFAAASVARSKGVANG